MHIGVRRPHFAVRGKFLLAVGILIPAVLAIALPTGIGLVRMAKHTDPLYTHNYATTQHIGQLVAATLTVHETALYQAATVDPLVRQTLGTELDTTLIPRGAAADIGPARRCVGRQGGAAAARRVRAGLSEIRRPAATKRDFDANYAGTLRRLALSTAGIVLLR